MIRLLAFVILSLALGWPGPAGTAEAKSRDEVEKGIGKKDTLWLRGAGRKHVQLTPMMAPVQKPTGRSMGSTAVTVVLEIPEADSVAKVCRVSPRVQDAINAAFYRHPIVFDKRELKLEEAGTRLVNPVNRALKKKYVSNVFVFQGAHSMGAGSLSKLPFASVLGCRELKVDGDKGNGNGKENGAKGNGGGGH